MNRKRGKDQLVLETMGGKLPPFNIEAEESVLSALLFSGNDRITVFNILTHEDAFWKMENREVFLSIKNLFDRGDKVDLVTVAEDLKRRGKYQTDVPPKHLAHLSSIVSGAQHLETHARIVMEAWMKRSIIQSATELLRGCHDVSVDVFELLDSAEKILLDNTGHLLKSTDKTFAEIADHAIEKMAAAVVGNILGIPTGLEDFDKRTSGLCEPDFTIIAARPGAGKSSLIFSVIAYLGKMGIPTGLVTLEMSQDQVFNRLVSIESGIASSKIRNNELSDAEKNRYYQYSATMKRWPVHINETASTLSKLRVKATMWKNKYGIKALFVDYLQLMGGDGKNGQNREGEISDISRGLKQLAKSLGIPVIALSQLSRKVEERPTKMPQLSDLRESGSLEQDADFVLFLMRPEYYKMTGTVFVDGIECPTDGLCIADLAKSRHGKTGEFPLKFIGPIMRFTNYSSGQLSLPMEANVQEDVF